MNVLSTPHGDLPLPAFLPDATRGAVRGVDAHDLRRVGIQAVMCNAFHLMRRPGAQRVRRLGGLHRFMGWTGPIVTDSGGFQVLSLVRGNRKLGAVREDGVLFRDPEGDGKVLLTPEKVLRAQLKLGSDVAIALDDCITPEHGEEEATAAVTRTLRWFERSRSELDKLKRPGDRPRLVGVVQGGRFQEQRARCLLGMVEAGADALGFGGWPVDAAGTLDLAGFELLAREAPADRVIFALGVGKPENVAAVAALSPRFVFDCTLPTRDARHHRLYVFRGGPPAPGTTGRDFYATRNALDERHAMEDAPIEEGCDCPCCADHSFAYLHHLFRAKDDLARRLATLHNLRFYVRLVEALRPRSDLSPAWEP